MPERHSDPERLPNETPRPPGELEALERAWAYPPGWRKISEINNSLVGVIYIGAAFLFFLLAGWAAAGSIRLRRSNCNSPPSDWSVYSPDPARPAAFAEPTDGKVASGARTARRGSRP